MGFFQNVDVSFGIFERSSIGLHLQVIIDSQPLTVAIIASIFFGETIGVFGVLGLATGVIGLLLLEVFTTYLFQNIAIYSINLMTVLS